MHDHDQHGLDVAVSSAGPLSRHATASAAFEAGVGRRPAEAIASEVAREAARYQRSIGHDSRVSRTLAERWQPHSPHTPAELESQPSQTAHRAATVSSPA